MPLVDAADAAAREQQREERETIEEAILFPFLEKVSFARSSLFAFRSKLSFSPKQKKKRESGRRLFFLFFVRPLIMVVLACSIVSKTGKGKEKPLDEGRRGSRRRKR